MQIVYHMGVHGTDNDRLVRSLLQNRDALWKNGTEVPTPTHYRGVIGQALNSLQGAPASAEMQEVVLDSILNNDRPERCIMSQPGFLGMPHRAVNSSGLYSNAGERMMALINLFPQADVEFFAAIKNPASLLNHVIPLIPNRSYHDILGGVDPRGLRWPDTIRRMAQAAQGRRLVIWCNEDTPLIWSDIIRRIGNMPADAPVSGGLQILAELIGPEPLAALRDKIKRENITDPDARLSAIEDTLATHANPDKTDAEITLPGWTQSLVDEMTAIYHADLAEIAAIQGVEFIRP